MISREETVADPRTTNGSQTDDLYRGDGQKSAGRLMKEVTEDLSDLVRKEIELAKQELGASLGEKAKGAAVLAIAAVIGFFALTFFLFAIRDALDIPFPTWLADILAGIIMILIGVLAVLFAKKKLATPVKADLTKQTIKDDVEWAKNLRKG
jgi:Putative Actinobacterial Holin-X, holin superfamily III